MARFYGLFYKFKVVIAPYKVRCSKQFSDVSAFSANQQRAFFSVVNKFWAPYRKKEESRTQRKFRKNAVSKQTTTEISECVPRLRIIPSKMDPSELRMNLASLQRIDPFIKEILMSSPQVCYKRVFNRRGHFSSIFDCHEFQVALYKYEGTEWEKTNIEGTLFVYARKCEPTYGFLILNRLSTTNLIQPVTPDIELQDKTPFLLYKTKVVNMSHGNNSIC